MGTPRGHGVVRLPSSRRADRDRPATGIVVVIALMRGFTRHSARAVGNVWVDLTRITLWVLLPIATALASNIIVATNVCGAGDSDDECFADRQQAMDEGFHTTGEILLITGVGGSLGAVIGVAVSSRRKGAARKAKEMGG